MRGAEAKPTCSTFISGRAAISFPAASARSARSTGVSTKSVALPAGSARTTFNLTRLTTAYSRSGTCALTISRSSPLRTILSTSAMSGQISRSTS